MWQNSSQISSSPGWVCALTATLFDIDPDATYRPHSLPSSSATRPSSRLIVGSSLYTSSPTSAAAIAALMPGVGFVTVSLRRSITGVAIVVSRRGLLLRLLSVFQEPAATNLAEEHLPALD